MTLKRPLPFLFAVLSMLGLVSALPAQQDAPLARLGNGIAAIAEGEIITLEQLRKELQPINPVAIVNKSYAKNSFMQPREVFNYVDDLREGLGMTFDKAGFTKGGRRMFVSLRKQNAIVVDPKVGDTMDEVLYLWSSFDGSVQHVINKMIERLVCSNGMVTMDNQASTKIKHSRIAGDKLQSFVSDNVDNIKATYSDTKDIVYSLAETPVSHSDAKEVINRIFKGESKRGENIRGLY